jgi:hypothetical protein
MSTYDLNYFQTDCKKKDEQVVFLQSMRQSRDEQFAARMRNTLQPWKIFTNPAEYSSDHDVSNNNPNKYINFHLNQLKYCP